MENIIKQTYGGDQVQKLQVGHIQSMDVYGGSLGSGPPFASNFRTLTKNLYTPCKGVGYLYDYSEIVIIMIVKNILYFEVYDIDR